MIVQDLLLGAYRKAVDARLLSTGLGRLAFELLYDTYKSWIEAGDLTPLRQLVAPGSVVIDVGANIGFFTRKFATWVGDDGCVVAIEPEPTNYSRLVARLRTSGLAGRVRCYQAVAAESSGTMALKVNPFHPGDHRLATSVDSGSALEVDALSLDTVCRDLGWPHVALVKIDVQGAEEMVLLGAGELLSRHHPALFVELDAGALREMGASIESVLALLTKHGYAAHRVRHGSISPPLSRANVLHECSSKRYADFLFCCLSTGRHNAASCSPERQKPPCAESLD